MKTFILSLGILSLFSFTNIDSSQLKDSSSGILVCKYNQCQGIAKSTGNQCKHCVSNAGDSYCYQHN